MMNFEYRETTKSDLCFFETWNQKENIVVDGKKFNNVSRFLTGMTQTFNEQVSDMLDSIETQNKLGIFTQHCISVLDKNKDVVGFVHYSLSELLDKTKQASINIIAVDPECQGLGYGTAIIFDLVKCREQIFGCNPQTIVTSINRKNTPSHKAFQKNNFEITSTKCDGVFNNLTFDISKNETAQNLQPLCTKPKKESKNDLSNKPDMSLLFEEGTFSKK